VSKTQEKSEEKSAEEMAIDLCMDAIYYDLIPEIVRICRAFSFQEADEVLEQTGYWEDPVMVWCKNSTWRKTNLSELADEVGLDELIDKYTVRFLGGPRQRALFEGRVSMFVADRILRCVKHWEGNCDDLIELLATYEAMNSGALDDAD
jgi:hypothetical protein